MAIKISNHLDLETIHRITGLAAPVALNDAVRKQDLDSAVAGLKDKASCRVATQGNINLAAPGATIDAIALTSGDRVLVKAQTAAAENGIYVWNGAAVPMTRALQSDTAEELEQAITTIEEGTNAGTTWRQTSVNFVLGTGPVNWVAFGTSSPPATTAAAGTVILATQTEVDSGPNSDDVVTVATLRNWANRKLKAVAQFGDGSATQFDLTHNFNTRDICVTVRRTAAPFDAILADWQALDVNTARIIFATAPAVNAFTATVLA